MLIHPLSSDHNIHQGKIILHKNILINPSSSDHCVNQRKIILLDWYSDKHIFFWSLHKPGEDHFTEKYSDTSSDHCVNLRKIIFWISILIHASSDHYIHHGKFILLDWYYDTHIFFRSLYTPREDHFIGLVLWYTHLLLIIIYTTGRSFYRIGILILLIHISSTDIIQIRENCCGNHFSIFIQKYFKKHLSLRYLKTGVKMHKKTWYEHIEVHNFTIKTTQLQ